MSLASSDSNKPPRSSGVAIPARGKQLSEADFASLTVTPGGQHYLATTPGGTKLVYDKNTLLMMRNSPYSKSPPMGLNINAIPGITKTGGIEVKSPPPRSVEEEKEDMKPIDEETQFDMD
uniref:Eukaryotic translation initiation factor 4E binding protein n=1 Tax=Palpitomonas bilix TaxID=652834 RepID=A0A7S3D4N4_9EUKA|mmetsp:Transcript_2187/g.4510  ORF Transcript_2187/g.4510 Transcript_2187/m.4510 type:complete len:120 (+) Transcript_2187:342-701(+)|eukprot:CAMPEP_0113880048 /NCGR_PEP_ID=MMETSP0780_2-20120614/7571_1 /TAXON_ID=652834 /ORGANISM="Palpitomonas bilix" /LENGTH=119 /DNA_ID=CAMNT_0000866685 /DNA_START=237 /DNA_END=596 /DNA_ORIENTATION=+ /assembly_acc=CAM_ASM_000599